MNLAQQLAAKKAQGLKKAEVSEKPPAPAPAPDLHGDLMAQILARQKKK